MVAVQPSRKPIMKKRAAFLNAAKGVFLRRDGFVIQRNRQNECDEARVGFTVTKKVGNAIVRNRARRRLREAVRLTDGALFDPGHDYVLIGRESTLSAGFESLCTDVETALRKLSRGEGKPARERRPRAPRR